MDGSWTPLLKDSIEGRPVELLRHTSGELRVKTTQKGTATSKGIFEKGSSVFPFVISDGEAIDIDAETPDHLIVELEKNGFTNRESMEIARHARNPPDFGYVSAKD